MASPNGSTRFRPKLDPGAPGVVATRDVANGMLLGFLLSWLPTPWSWLAVVPLGWAIVAGVKAIVELPRTSGLGVLKAWLGIGIVASLVLLGTTLLPLLAAPWTGDYRECMSGANTAIAKAQCRADHGNWWTDLLGEEAVF